MAHVAPRPDRSLRRGIWSMVAAAALFTVMTAAVRQARQALPTLDVMLWRVAFALPALLPFALRGGLRVVSWRGIVLRSVLGFVAMVCFFTAARGLSVADLTLVSKLQPIWVALLAPRALGAGERVGRALWWALLLGLLGSGFIVGPELRVGNVHGLWALGATLASAAAHVTVRALGRTDRPEVTAFGFQVVLLPLVLLARTFWQGAPAALPPTHLWWVLLLVGLTSAGAQLLMSRAYALAPAPVVAGASYSAPLFAFVADLVAFGEVPRPEALLGGALVLAGGALLLRRDDAPSEAHEPPAE